MRLSEIIRIAKISNRVDSDDEFDHVEHSINLLKSRIDHTKEFMITEPTRNKLMNLGLASIEKNFDLIKLPYPECWFEIPAHVNEDLHGKGAAYVYQDSDGIHLMCMTYNKAYHGGKEAYNLWAAKDFCTVKVESGEIEVYLNTWEVDKAYARTISMILCVVLNLVLFLNTPGTVVEVNHDMSKVNKKRLESGKSTVSDYVEISLDKKVYQSLASGDGSDGVGLHWRRGHFKRKKNGLFWWNPHLVGDGGNGDSKGYRV
jgi:hypothetical protein